MRKYNIIRYILIVIFVLLILYTFIHFLNKIYINKEDFEIKKYKEIMLHNDKKKLYKISLSEETEIMREDCNEKCNAQECIKLHEKTKLLGECIKCNMQKGKCYEKSIIGGVCNDCDIENIEDKINCLGIDNFGCVNPTNLNDIGINSGIEPYYIEVPDNNPNSPYNKKCVFCWNILDNI